MAVAEKPATKASPRDAVQQLALASFLGAAYVVGSLSVVFSVIPTIWDYVLGMDKIFNEFLSTALVMILSTVAGVGLFVLGRHLEGPNRLRGQRAGTMIGALLVFFIFVVSFSWIGNSLVARDAGEFVSWVAILGIAGVLLAGVYLLYNQPAFAKFLVRQEENGWFTATSFKFNQGQKVRRATLIALLVVVGGGIIGNLRSGVFGTGNWIVELPGVDSALVVLFNIQYTIPFLLFMGFGWLVWRAVNWPTFADFLIATEAEINKVSWTTRKRLFQDTIVVLVTLLLFTIFLFVVDILWIRILSMDPFPGVLQINPTAAKQKQLGPTDW